MNVELPKKKFETGSKWVKDMQEGAKYFSSSSFIPNPVGLFWTLARDLVREVCHHTYDSPN